MKKQIRFMWGAMWGSFHDIFNFKDPNAAGRSIQLSSALLTTFYNVFITGIFYTGFLSMYGMSITDMGILTFVPYAANMLSMFSSKLLERHAKRKKILLTSKIIFYALYILLTTIMPQIVTDPQGRLICFCLIMFVAHAIYAPFAPGFTIWFYSYFPKESDRRNRFQLYLQLFGSILSSIILVTSGFITDALEGSRYQDMLILGFRYFAFILVLFDVFVQSRAKEPEYPKAESAKLTDIFTLPFKYKKFLACMILMFVWNFTANLNNGLWNYHLLNHLNFSYGLLNSVSVLYTVILVILNSPWQRFLRRYSWIKTFGIVCIFWIPTEIIFFFLNPNTTFLYLPLVIVQHILCVGLNLSYSNILYMNLPDENPTALIAFNTIGCNIFALFGIMVGTWISSITGDNTFPMLGMDVYSVQFTVFARAIMIGALGVICTLFWKKFTSEEHIEEALSLQSAHKIYREHMKADRKQFFREKREKLSQFFSRK